MIHVRLYHEVMPGETLLEILGKYNLNFAKLMELDKQFLTRNPNCIQVGELIRIQ